MTMLTRRASLAVAALPGAAQTADPLPSWRQGPRRQALLDFVTAVTTEGGPDFVRPAERVAAFDNDGTLWVEQPLYTQFIFILERIRDLAPRNPGWQQDPVFRGAISGDMREDWSRVFP